jgi:hypothetical protein
MYLLIILKCHWLWISHQQEAAKGGDDEDDDLEVSTASVLFFLGHLTSLAKYLI